MTRRPTTIFAADVVGYSVLMAENEAGTLKALCGACAARNGVQLVRSDAVCRDDRLVAAT